MAFPKWFYFSMIAVFIIPLLVGCSAATTISNGASFAVSKYCDIPSVGRSAVRKAVDSAVAPNSIKITCSND